jgi:hypothetical protein
MEYSGRPPKADEQELIEELDNAIDRKDVIKLLQNAERLRLPLQNYIKMILKRDHSQTSTSV